MDNIAITVRVPRVIFHLVDILLDLTSSSLTSAFLLALSNRLR